jgi:protein-disulfide isomerase
MIKLNENRFKFLFVLSVAGLGIAVLSSLEGRLEWLSALCGFFGEGCRDTAAFKLAGLSVWIWGVAFYAVLAGAILFFRPLVFWLAMIGLGAESSFGWVMFSMHLACIFCLVNAVVVVLLVILCLDKKRIWQTVAIGLLVFMISSFLLSGQYPAAAQRRNQARSSSVVATVGGDKISALELVGPLASRIYRLQQDIYQLKRDRLEELIDRKLLAKEAEQKGITLQQLLDSLLSKKGAVSDEAVNRFYLQNQSRWVNWSGTVADLKQRIRNYLEELETRQAIRARATPLRDRYPVKVYLAPPTLPLTHISVGDSPVWGPANAAVTVVEFSDYLCPACRRAHETTKKIRQTFAGKIRWVFKDFPLDRHPGSRQMAVAARCARAQGHFWDFQDRLFVSPGRLDDQQLTEYARKMGLDEKQFGQCLANETNLANVEKDIQAGREAGVDSTPTFIINGRVQPGGLPYKDFKHLIDEELKKAGQRSDPNRWAKSSPD